MTEGRFETTHNMRPEQWDNRRHWTNWHHLYDCELDHLQRESAPFHDLRAGGQFQYEYWGSHEANAQTEPHVLNKRKDGDRMDFSRGPRTGIGGAVDIPLDVEPGRPTVSTARDVKAGPWTKESPLNRGLFSEFPYLADGQGDGERAATDGDGARSLDGPRASDRHGVMKTGGGPWLNGFPKHIPDPMADRKDRGRVGGFRAGKANGLLHQQPEWQPEGERTRRRKKGARHFYAGKPNGFTFNGPVEHIPDPYDFGTLKNERRPFQTWHTRTKWSMPVDAPWTAGKTTAEPAQGAQLPLSEGYLPTLQNSKVCDLKQSIGKEAALAGGAVWTVKGSNTLKSSYPSIYAAPPDPVRFKKNP